MTLEEGRTRVLSLLDETRPKNDLKDKLIGFFDRAQKAVSLVCPIIKTVILEQGEGAYTLANMPTDCRKPVDLYLISDDGKRLYFNDYRWIEPNGVQFKNKFSGTLKAEYEAYPQTIDLTSDGNAEFELPEKANDAMIYFVAAHTQAMEYDLRYFNNFYALYQGEMANLMANRKGIVTIETGENRHGL